MGIVSCAMLPSRREKARQGGWNGAKPPYGYHLVNGNVTILPEEAEHIKLIFDKYVNTNLGLNGVARWMNDHGYKKYASSYNGIEVFTEGFIDRVITNHTYCGKIAFGKRTTVLKEGSEYEYHVVWTDDYQVYEGQHEAIISEELFEAAQAKKKANAKHHETIEKDHEYIYSALLKCPNCGKSLFGVPMRNRKKSKERRKIRNKHFVARPHGVIYHIFDSAIDHLRNKLFFTLRLDFKSRSEPDKYHRKNSEDNPCPYHCIGYRE